MIGPSGVMRDVLDTSAPPSMRAWAERLPETVAEVAAHWGLDLEPPYEPGGQCSWTAPCGDLVLKVGWRHPESEHEADALRVWSGDGAVLLHDELVTETTRALLLERCRPGAWLVGTLAPEDQDVVLARLLRRLWPAGTAGFPSLVSLCDLWADEAEREGERHGPGAAA